MRDALVRAGAVAFVSGTLVVGGIAGTASAQPPIGPIGAHNLVNVQISNLVNNNNISITVPINAAANICGVDVAVLAEQVETAPVECDSRANQDVTVSQTQ